MRLSLGLRVLATALVVVVTACGRQGQSAGLDPELVATGAELYQENCASCHRADLSGDPDWKTPNEDGSYPPPPHDSSGHTWHHPDRVLIDIIREGGSQPESRMPAFGDRLIDDDIRAILEFFKDNWGPDERAYQQQVTEQDQASP